MGEQVGYKKLFVWQKADQFAFEIYGASKSFPRSEIFGITSQLRRAALSIPTNLAEGQGRQGKKEFRQFVNIALGSATEAEYLLDFAYRLHYLDQQTWVRLQGYRREVSSLLWKLFQSLY
jgi:four helix bundle protein